MSTQFHGNNRWKQRHRNLKMAVAVAVPGYMMCNGNDSLPNYGYSGFPKIQCTGRGHAVQCKQAAVRVGRVRTD